MKIGDTTKLKFDSIVDKAIMTGGRIRLRPIEAGETTELEKGTELPVVDMMDVSKLSKNLGVSFPVVELPDQRLAVVAIYDVE